MPMPFDALLKLTDAARDRGDWFAAAEGYKLARSINPEAYSLAVQQGHALKESGRYEAAEACYREFQEVEPEDADVHLQLGHLFRLRGDTSAARSWYLKAVELAKSDDRVKQDALDNLSSVASQELIPKRQEALALTDLGQFAAARELLLELVDSEAQEDLVGILGHMHKELGDLEAARKAYNRFADFAQAYKPEMMFDSHIQLGHLEKIEKNFSKAIAHFTQAKACAPETFRPQQDRNSLNTEISLCLAQVTKAIILVECT